MESCSYGAAAPRLPAGGRRTLRRPTWLASRPPHLLLFLMPPLVLARRQQPPRALTAPPEQPHHLRPRPAWIPGVRGRGCFLRPCLPHLARWHSRPPRVAARLRLRLRLRLC